jgi:spermidine synthase
MMFLYLGLALVSAAGLAFEITLTRLFAIAQGYHFGFLAISLALLGLGASGTALALRPALARVNVTPRLAGFSFVFSISLVACYLAVNYLPFDSYRVAFERAQWLYLALYYFALVAPFFLSGLVLGMPLAALPGSTGRVYAANLVGSAAGCITAPAALTVFGGPGAVIVAALCAALGALAFALSDVRGLRDRAGLLRPILLFTAALIALWGVLLLALPSLFDVQISPYKGLSQLQRVPDARSIFSGWNAFSRIEVVASSTVRSAPGLALTYRGDMPTQRALFEDAESISPLTDAAPPALLDALPVTLAYQLRPNARALILSPGGGLEVLAALNAGAREIVAVEENPLLVQVAREYAPHAFGDPRVRVVASGARGFLARSPERFDLVHLALSDAFRPVTAGAYALGENYTYTLEAFRDYLSHLDDDGILVVSRWLQLPPTEEIRAGALAIQALQDSALLPVDHILALRSFSTMLLLVKRTPFTAREIEIARAFAEQQQFDWVAAPDLRFAETERSLQDASRYYAETNRYNFLPNNDYFSALQPLLSEARRAQFIADYAYDITPPTDDRPFFFHFFKWEQTPQVLQLAGRQWQPFGGSGYLILFALLALSVAASGALILIPLTRLERGEHASTLRHASRQGRLRLRAGGSQVRDLVYFGCLGIGFLFVEIPLIQRFILFLDHPVYAFAVVLFALLLASGAGSLVSARVSTRGALAALVAAILVYPLALPFLFQAFLGCAFALRLLVAVGLLAPMGFLMGIPFPKGIARLNETAPRLVPLAWGVNGCASVLSSILATIGALTWGFSAVMLAGAGAYALAWLAANRTKT